MSHQFSENLIRSAAWRLQRIRSSPYIPVFPEPKQAAAILHPAREVLYGGAAGGGKSVALLIAALEWVDVYPVQSLILRRTFQHLSLPAALIPLAAEWLGETDAVWNGNQHQWAFPSGATLTFGFMDAENDRFRYQGAAFHLIGFDELTQFRETDYRYVFSRQRRPKDSPIPIRTFATSNPGGIGHDWVFRRFFSTAVASRIFIPAGLEDNPHLDREEYETSLLELDPITYRQLRHGDWSVKPTGGWFEKDNFEVVDEVPALQRTVRYWDMAATVPKAGSDPDYTVGLLLGLGVDNQYYVLDVTRFREAPARTELYLKKRAIDDDIYLPSIWLEQEPGSSGVVAVDHIIRDVLPGYAVFADRKDRSKADRARPVAAAASRKLIKLLRAPWNEALLDELQGFPMGSHDDQVDGLSGAFAKIREQGVGIYTSTEAPVAVNGWEGYSLDDGDADRLAELASSSQAPSYS